MFCLNLRLFGSFCVQLVPRNLIQLLTVRFQTDTFFYQLWQVFFRIVLYGIVVKKNAKSHNKSTQSWKRLNNKLFFSHPHRNLPCSNSALLSNSVAEVWAVKKAIAPGTFKNILTAAGQCPIHIESNIKIPGITTKTLSKFVSLGILITYLI